jgi:hypothetical protein
MASATFLWTVPRFADRFVPGIRSAVAEIHFVVSIQINGHLTGRTKADSAGKNQA